MYRCYACPGVLLLWYHLDITLLTTYDVFIFLNKFNQEFDLSLCGIFWLIVPWLSEWLWKFLVSHCQSRYTQWSCRGGLRTVFLEPNTTLSTTVLQQTSYSQSFAATDVFWQGWYAKLMMMFGWARIKIYFVIGSFTMHSLEKIIHMDVPLTFFFYSNQSYSVEQVCLLVKKTWILALSGTFPQPWRWPATCKLLFRHCVSIFHARFLLRALLYTKKGNFI